MSLQNSILVYMNSSKTAIKYSTIQLVLGNL
jgi:hypothetical protein